VTALVWLDAVDAPVASSLRRREDDAEDERREEKEEHADHLGVEQQRLLPAGDGRPRRPDPELADLLFFGLGSVLLTGVGVYVEEIALATVQAGKPELGAWFAVMGAMAFYFGLYLMGYREFRTRLGALRRDLA
jgi:hypothetical protein